MLVKEFNFSKIEGRFKKIYVRFKVTSIEKVMNYTDEEINKKSEVQFFVFQERYSSKQGINTI